MNVAHENLPGLDRDRVHAAVGPVLAAHAVECVELVWRTDRGGWVLEVTVERPDASAPGSGVDLDTCSEISRDLSAALDVSDCISHRYTLEVGTPGLERALYAARDYARFAGRKARLKLCDAESGQHVMFGTLRGLDPEGRALLETVEGRTLAFELSRIQSARLQFEWGSPARGSERRGRREPTRRLSAGRPERSR